MSRPSRLIDKPAPAARMPAPAARENLPDQFLHRLELLMPGVAQ